MWNNRYRINFSGESEYNNAQRYRRREQEMNGLSGNNIMMERRDVENRENGSNSEAMKNETKKGEISWLKSLMVFCKSVSVIGLSYVANTSASAFRRSFWFLLILVGAAFTTFQIQDRIRYYFRHPVNVIIREEYAKEMTFPTVTLCSENQISLSKATSIGRYRCCDLFKYLLTACYSKCCNYSMVHQQVLLLSW